MPPLRRFPVSVAFVAALGTALCARASTAQSLDLPTAIAWPAEHEWDDAMESRYSDFVATIGRAVAAGRCGTLSHCLNNPSINPLFIRSGRRVHIHADCADVPYTLRAWFAYRNHLPFAYARTMRGSGHDPRYLRNARATGTRLWTNFATPRDVLQSISSDVHSGFLRTAPDIEDSDFYQTTVDRRGIRPGTSYYDPNGHVLVVYEIHDDGEILMFDGHPDNTLSHPRFSERYFLGSARSGGGFKNFRPISWQNGVLVRWRNVEIPTFGGVEQFDATRRVGTIGAVTFHAWVRARMATASAVSTVTSGGQGAQAPARPTAALPAIAPGSPRRRLRAGLRSRARRV